MSLKVKIKVFNCSGGASASLCDKHVSNDDYRRGETGRIGDEDDTRANGYQMERQSKKPRHPKEITTGPSVTKVRRAKLKCLGHK